MVSSSALMASLKALLVWAGAVSIAAVALGAAVPSISGSLGPRLPPPALGWFRSWFRPPYHFVFVNVIIAAVAATSRCFHRAQPERIAVTVVEEMEVMEATPAAAEAFDESKDFEEKKVVVATAAAAAAAGGNGVGSGGGDGYNGDCEGERKVAFGRSASARRRRVDSSEKAPVPPRRARRKAGGGDPLQGKKGKGGKDLRRSNENMKHVLKEITEAEAWAGAVMSVTRHVKADDIDHQINLPELPPPMRKSATFKDRINRRPPLSPIKLRREPSLDDLNRRAEVFINEFKEGLRLQR